MLLGEPVFLLTDILIFVLVLSIVSFFAYAMRKPHLRQPWGQVVRSRAGIISMIVLSVYVAIALLDSLLSIPYWKITSPTPKRCSTAAR